MEDDSIETNNESIDFSSHEEIISNETMETEEGDQISLVSIVEAIIFASANPVKSSEILEYLREPETNIELKSIEDAIKALEIEFGGRSGGFSLVNLGLEGYQFQTVPGVAPIMEKIFSNKPRPLSKAALETLAIVAYRQPVTRAEIEFIRGVDSGSIFKNLMERELISCVGRKEDVGRPMIFGTTPTFLTVFGLDSLADMPPLVSFQPASDLVKATDERLQELQNGLNVGELVSGEPNPGPSSDDAEEDFDGEDL